MRTHRRFRLPFRTAGVPALLLAIGVIACRAPDSAMPETDDARLTAFLDAEFTEWLTTDPQLATRLGVRLGADRWNDIGDKAAREQVEWRKASVARMREQFDRNRLSAEGQVNYDIWALEAERAAMTYANRLHTPPFYSSLRSLHSALPDFLVNAHTVTEAADLRSYVGRLRALPSILDTAIALSRRSDSAGIRAPRFQIESVIAGSEKLISGAPFGPGPDAPLWADVQAKASALVDAGTMPRTEADALLAEARAAILDLAPAYRRVIAWATGNLATAPSGRVGAVSLPDGAGYYARELQLNTTTALSADSIHAIGKREVARIEAEQDALARKAGFADRTAFYADRARRFPPRPFDDAVRAEQLERANALVAKTRAQLGPWFATLPAYRIEVVREPSFSEVVGGSAHASPPSPDGARPGRTYMHLVGTTQDPATLYTLMCHEAIPGHNMHLDILIRQRGAPRFRQATLYNAYLEGWGLYSEALCGEMRLYPDVAAEFMSLDAQLFRAARLVVDTGIHALGWTEDEAVAYLSTTARQTPERSRNEVRRYITLPAQATAYQIGMLTIMAQRRKAEAALGTRFDIKGYHDLLIGSGPQPLSIFERRVGEWIAARAK